MVFLVKPSEIGPLLQRASQGTFSTGLAHGSQGVCPTSVDTPPLLKRSDFVAAGATLVSEEDHPTPAFDFIFGWIWLLALIAHCVTGLFLGGDRQLCEETFEGHHSPIEGLLWSLSMAPKTLPRPKAGTLPLPPTIQRPSIGNGLAPGDFVPNFSCYSYWISVELLVQLLFSGRQTEQLLGTGPALSKLCPGRLSAAHFCLAPLRRLCPTLRENFGCSAGQYSVHSPFLEQHPGECHFAWPAQICGSLCR